jgi:hypothetical protein
MKNNCGQCKHFEKPGYANWGNCTAPYPEWVCVDEHENTVWVVDGHPQNYAKICDLFELPNV